MLLGRCSLASLLYSSCWCMPASSYQAAHVSDLTQGVHKKIIISSQTRLVLGKLTGRTLSMTISGAQCYENELPALERATKYRGIVVSGSHYSAYEDRPWINALKAWIRNFVKLNAHTRLIGICFGTQVSRNSCGAHDSHDSNGSLSPSAATAAASNCADPHPQQPLHLLGLR